MSQFRDEYRGAMGDAPWTIWKTFTHVILPLVGVLTLLGAIFYAMSWGDEAAQVAKDEFGPKAALAKYEWFKDAASQLSRKQADITVYQQRLTSLKAGYGEKPRSEWAREDREQSSIWESEVAGVISSYNGLAAEYNAASSKFNWSGFQGDQPGGSGQIPREFAPYVTGGAK